MKFSTPINQPLFNKQLKLSDSIFTIGSCFSQTIGDHLHQNKFEICNNRFGTVYNPDSIFRILRYCLDVEQPSTSKNIKNGEVYYNFDFHSDLSSLSAEELNSMIEDRIASARTFLKNTNWIIITFGTAIVYQLKATNEVVANCHKVPLDKFAKDTLSVDQILSDFEGLHKELLRLNPHLNIILAVSPVRHIKDGLQDNAYSKSILRVACEELRKSYANTFYYPSFEIMVDELRDYRYYKSDLIHPSDQAEDYIWEIFKSAFISEEERVILDHWNKVRTSLEHRPRHPETNAHQLFLKNLLAKLEELKMKINVESEIQELKAQIGKG